MDSQVLMCGIWVLLVTALLCGLGWLMEFSRRRAADNRLWLVNQDHRDLRNSYDRDIKAWMELQGAHKATLSRLERAERWLEEDGLPSARFLLDIDAELLRARAKFPRNRFQVTALMEEVGELGNALLEHAYGKGSVENVRKEAVQVAAMACRVAEEGSEEFGEYCEYLELQKRKPEEVARLASESVR